MLHHALKVPDAIAKCKGIIPSVHHQWYLKFYSNSKEKVNSKKRSANENAIIASDLQSNDVSSLQSSKKQ